MQKEKNHPISKAAARILGLSFLICVVIIGSCTLWKKRTTPPDLPTKNLGPGESLNIEFVRQLGGGIDTGQLKPLAVQGNYVYAGLGHRLAVLDISNLPNIVLVGQSGIIPDNLGEVVLAGHYVYTAPGVFGDKPGNLQKLNIVDVSDPTRPQYIGAYAPQVKKVISVGAWGNSLYVTAKDADSSIDSWDRSLYLLDISNPALPREISHMDFSQGVSDVAISGNTLYVGTSTPGLRVLDVSRPEAPKEVYTLYPSGGDQDLAISGNYLYYYGAHDRESNWSLHVLDISNPRIPSELGFLDIGFQNLLFVTNDIAYFLDFNFQDLTLINVSKPNEPREAGTQNFEGHVLSIQGNFAFVWDANKLKVFDISNPNKPEELGVFNSILVPDDTLPELYIGGSKGVVPVDTSLYFLDFSNPTSPMIANLYDIPGLRSVQAIQGNYVYLYTYPSQYLEAWDISDPNLPVIVWHHEVYDNNNRAYYLVVAGKYLYLINPESGFFVYDNSNPANPQLLSHQPDLKGYGDSFVDYAVSRNFLYVLDGRDLRILDISNPTHFFEVGSFSFPSNGSGYERITVIDNLAFLDNSLFNGTDPATLAVLDVSDPAKPRLIASYYWDEFSALCGISKKEVFINDWDGIHIVDFSDPKKPKEIGYYGLRQESGTGPSSMVLGQDNLIYVVTYPNGLYVLRYKPPPQ